MRTLLPSCAVLLAVSFAPAQTDAPPAAADLAAAKKRLAAALQKCSQLEDTAFTVKWGPNTRKKVDDDPLARMLAARNSGETHGSWHRDLTRVTFAGDQHDELLVVGARTIARDDDRDWQLRAGRFADGNPVAWVPDVGLLLRRLASWDLEVTQRSVGSLEDRPVELITVALDANQVAEAVWAGLLPETIATAMGFGGAQVVRLAAAGAAAGAAGAGRTRPAATAPKSTIDLVVHLDPGTNLVHRLQFRGWTKENAMAGAGGAGVFVVQGGGVNVARAGGDEDDEDEQDVDPNAPLVYENGLPVRPRKKTSVFDVVVTLSEHGHVEAPALSDAQQQLLGR